MWYTVGKLPCCGRGQWSAMNKQDAQSKTTWEKRFDELTFTDDYIFKLVMDDAAVFKTVLGVIMP